MKPFGFLNHCRTDVDPDTITRLKASQHRAGSAADFQHARPRRDKKSQIAQIFFVEEGRSAPKYFPASCEALRVPENFFFSGG